MTSLLLEPEFIVSPTGNILPGPLRVDDGVISGASLAGVDLCRRIELPSKMLFPGFINTHSHALQRALRGRVEKNNVVKGKSDFWSWRSAMYQDVLRFDLDAIEAIASWCYLELIKAGFVAVAEFQYIHHDPQGKPYHDPADVSRRLARAAEKVGIRLVLLQTAYARNGYQQPALPEQRRFTFDSATEFLAFAKHIRKNLKSDLLTHGLAIHSVRACPSSWIEEISHEAKALNLPLHVHACEQKQEITACIEEHGIGPIALLDRCGALSPKTTLVHATHVDDQDIDAIASSGSLVSLCPSTEKNLGDGFCPVADLANAQVPLCIGTDQHVRIDAADELRAIEENERLRLQRRHILTKAGETLAQTLVPIGTQNGRRSIFGPDPDGMAPATDVVAISVPVEGNLFGPATALDAWLVSGSSKDISDVFVAGNHVVKNGMHLAEDEIHRTLSGLRPRLMANH